ncbi:MAG: formimidoylglutamate deiminase [Oligoflexales bacterium]|nr:formimidoylglutamate deiminase [Oligoflexales bacterium]
MKTYFFQKALIGLDRTRAEWLSPAYITVDHKGSITSLSQTPPAEDTEVEAIAGVAIPGFMNAHSHAFQYAMAGSAEYLSLHAAHDDFWTWRQAMYHFSKLLNPSQMFSIAKRFYSELLRHGYTDVVEFHYLHHQANGEKYDTTSIMAQALLDAAKFVNINIVMVPIFYHCGDFNKPASALQSRFISKDVDEFALLWEAVAAYCRKIEHGSMGIGAHSLRAVQPDQLFALIDLAKHYPFHMHIAEQKKEVENCLAQWGQRPVRWLLDHVAVDDRWNLVHATHMDTIEVELLAKSKANIVLCPSTEGNLGDGFFPLKSFLSQGGCFSIGSDSHVGLNPFEELRMLEYAQRLQFNTRNPLAKPGEYSANILLDQVWSHAHQASGEQKKGIFALGTALNCVVIKPEFITMGVNQEAHLLGQLLLSADSSWLLSVINRGKICAKEGKHLKHKEISAVYQKTVKEFLPLPF